MATVPPPPLPASPVAGNPAAWGWRVIEDGPVLELRKKWRAPANLLFFALILFWLAVSIAWLGWSLWSGAWFRAGFGLLVTAIGGYLFYLQTAQWLNSTVLRVADGWLEIEARPVPGWGRCRLPMGDIAHLKSRWSTGQGEHGPITSWALDAVLRDGRGVNLFSQLSGPDEIRFLEQRLGRHLNLAPGEIHPEP